MEEEIWKPIKDYEGLYEVSNLGRVKSLNYRKPGKEKILKNIESNYGYLMVGLTKNGKQKLFTVHRLVAETFIPNLEGKPCIDHINTVKSDNRVENLRWVTYEENNNNPLTKKKYSENHRKQNSEETKKKLSESKKGKHCGENNPKSKPVVQIDLNTNEVINTYFGTREAARQTGFNQSNISKCCRGKQKSHKGYKWKFLEDYNKLNEEN